jgi:hypothetical protein
MTLGGRGVDWLVESQLRETLLAYHPAVVGVFSSVDRDATLAFLRDYPTPEAASRIGSARMAAFCKRVGYSGRVPIEVLVGRLRTNLLSASRGSINGHCFAAPALADQPQMLNDQIRRFNHRIDELLARHPDTIVFSSFPAVGRITAAELLVEIREDRQRFPTVGVLLEAGAAPVTLAFAKVRGVRIRYA